MSRAASLKMQIMLSKADWQNFSWTLQPPFYVKVLLMSEASF
jgi:hypothetical protein